MTKILLIAFAFFAAGPASIHKFKVSSIDGDKIDFSSLKSGLYFVKITSGNNSGVIKINKL
jgi:hypothetical protein